MKANAKDYKKWTEDQTIPSKQTKERLMKGLRDTILKAKQEKIKKNREHLELVINKANKLVECCRNKTKGGRVFAQILDSTGNKVWKMCVVREVKTDTSRRVVFRKKYQLKKNGKHQKSHVVAFENLKTTKRETGRRRLISRLVAAEAELHD